MRVTTGIFSELFEAARQQKLSSDRAKTDISEKKAAVAESSTSWDSQPPNNEDAGRSAKKLVAPKKLGVKKAGARRLGAKMTSPREQASETAAASSDGKKTTTSSLPKTTKGDDHASQPPASAAAPIVATTRTADQPAEAPKLEQQPDNDAGQPQQHDTDSQLQPARDSCLLYTSDAADE